MEVTAKPVARLSKCTEGYHDMRRLGITTYEIDLDSPNMAGGIYDLDRGGRAWRNREVFLVRGGHLASPGDLSEALSLAKPNQIPDLLQIESAMS